MIAAPPEMGCAVCLQPLSSHYQLPSGRLTHSHGVTPVIEHDPLPVPLESLDATEWICDWCSGPAPLWSYQVHTAMLVTETDNEHTTHNFGGAWATCADCSVHISNRRPPPLSGHLNKGRYYFQRAIAATARTRSLIVSTGWKHEPLRGVVLPAVRDRVAALMRRDRDTLPMADHTTRHVIADGLDAAAFFWIDAKFCELVTHAAVTLPPTAFTIAELRARNGFLAWANPMHPQHGTCAVSWSATPSGWQLTWYRTPGTSGYQATKHVRDTVGWLLPTASHHVRSGDFVDAGHPAAILLASLLLLNQTLAETIEAEPEPSVVKAYQRRNRPVPTIRLVYIRPRRSGTSRPAEPGTRPPAEYRVLVGGELGGFFRSQAYGPGHSLRKTVYIEPYWRGDDTLPLRPGTVVRVLGSAKAPRNEGVPA